MENGYHILRGMSGVVLVRVREVAGKRGNWLFAVVLNQTNFARKYVWWGLRGGAPATRAVFGDGAPFVTDEAGNGRCAVELATVSLGDPCDLADSAKLVIVGTSPALGDALAKISPLNPAAFTVEEYTFGMGAAPTPPRRRHAWGTRRLVVDKEEGVLRFDGYDFSEWTAEMWGCVPGRGVVRARWEDATLLWPGETGTQTAWNLAKHKAVKNPAPAPAPAPAGGRNRIDWAFAPKATGGPQRPGWSFVPFPSVLVLVIGNVVFLPHLAVPCPIPRSGALVLDPAEEGGKRRRVEASNVTESERERWVAVRRREMGETQETHTRCWAIVDDFLESSPLLLLSQWVEKDALKEEKKKGLRF
jgi:hypothetical protein